MHDFANFGSRGVARCFLDMYILAKGYIKEMHANL